MYGEHASVKASKPATARVSWGITNSN